MIDKSRLYEMKQAHYDMWNDIAQQVKRAEAIGDELSPLHLYKALWVKEHWHDPQPLLYNCFACTVCEQNCNECPLKDALKGCYDVWTDGVVPAFREDEYSTAYDRYN